MFLLLSGEGPTDIGVADDEIGPLTKLVVKFMADYLDYSLIDFDQFAIVRKEELVTQAKRWRPRSRVGKKENKETRYYYNNAQAFAEIVQDKYAEHENSILILFRDADGTQSADRGHWQDKWNSMMNGFQSGNVSTGVPMIPMPKSEAWMLCALRDQYQSCAILEQASGNDNAPNALKSQLREHLGVDANRELLNQKVDDGEIDIRRIDMPSMNHFKARLQEVLAECGWRNLRV